ncbi:MAG TPA: peptidase S41 [Saprospirales bacterium]|nr:peptidase S41 [Saprospirales bacterium]
MKNIPFFALLFLLVNQLAAQKDYNLGFEQSDPTTSLPFNWQYGTGGTSKNGYSFTRDSINAFEGKGCARLAFVPESGTFGAFSMVVPVDFKGEMITLKGYIKTENIIQDGWAGIWLRQDGESGVVGFDNMQERGLKGNNGWQQFETRVLLNKDAQNIVFGGLLVGSGIAWFDNIELLIDGKAFWKAPKQIITQKPAELDTMFRSGSRVQLGQLTPERINDLVILGKVWGFLKYHHPKVASGDIHWDYELFRFLQRYPEGLKARQRDDLLAEWIISLGTLPKCRSCAKKITDDIRLTADLAWLDDSNLSPALRKQLKIVYENRNQSDHFYIDHEKNIGNPKFRHESAYSQFKYPDEGYRLLCVYRFWNIIQYFFPYRDVIGEDWTGVMQEFIPKMIQCKDALSYKLCTRELIGRIHDTHANLWMQDEELVRYFGEKRPALQIKFIENQAVVTGYYHPDYGAQTGLLPGDVITAIEGVPVVDLLKQKLPLYPASNLPTKLRDIARDLLRTNANSLHLKVRRGQTEKDMEVACFDAVKEKFNLDIDRAYNQPDSCYRLLTPEIGYMHLGTLKQEHLAPMMAQFKDTKGIILDIRNYPSDFTVFSLTEYLKNESTKFVYFTAGSVSNPGTFTQTDALYCGETNRNSYKGKIVILVNELTQSSAEYHSMAFRSVPGAIVVGSTTAGADGNVSRFSLPGGLNSMISGIGVFYPDGTPTQRVGIVPDYPVSPTIEGVKMGRDEVLDFAREWIMKQ